MSNAKAQRYFSTIALTLTGFTASSGILAEEVKESNPTFTINKVLVSATREEQTVGETARSIAVVEKEELESIQPQSVAQAIRYEPNVSVTGGPRAGSQSVNIRGLEGSKVLQTIDGVRQVFESGHRPSYFLDPELLKSIEVVKGPASSLWGSGALGGVVSQNTINASDILKPDQNLGGFVKAGFNANNDQQTYVSTLAGRTETLDWLLSAYYRDSNDAELGNGDNLPDSSKQDEGALAKAEWQIDDNQSLGLSYRQSNEDGQIPSNGATNVNGTSVFLIERETETQNAVLDYKLDTDSELVNGSLKAYWNNVDMQEARVSDGRGDGTELDVYGLALNNISELSGFKLFYGVDGYQEDFSATRGGTDRPIPPEAETTVWGAYVKAEYDLTTEISVAAGARYDDFETEAENIGAKSDDNDVSPSISLSWQANDVVEVILRHEQAFRAPSSEELYTTGTHFCMFPGFCNTFVSNPDLKSEKASNNELITRLSFAPNAQGGQWYVEGSIFENKVDDFIEQIVSGPTFFPIMDPGTTTWVNVDDATIKGFELASTYVQDGFTFKLGYGQTRGKDDNSDEDLTNIPADKLIADVSYKFIDKRLSAGVKVSKFDAQNRTNYAANTSGTTYDGYTLADLYASWKPSMVEGLKLDLTVNNLTDRYYQRAWEQLKEPGREVILSTKYAF